SYLANVLALREVRAHGAFEGLLRGEDGSWSEATTSNLFTVSGGRVTTPGVDDHILPGITRALVLSLARSEGIEVEEARLDDEALDTADEIFLTSSIKEVLPISRLDGIPVADQVPGPVTRRLMGLYSRAVIRVQQLKADRIADVYPRV
ncbi:MAG: aminotransferase class IV, partial [Myxococcota bacterium]|nr:aminotransferase class IV [Myxococcota bacterium]